MMDDREVRKERSGFRDPDLETWHREHGFEYPVASTDIDFSLRHRDYGWNCPGVDIDWLFLEYDQRFPIALVDYKLRKELRGQEPDKNAANYVALSRLRTIKGPLPFYANFYDKNPWVFRVFPMNDQARQLAPKRQILTEAEYVTWLYWLRGRVIDSFTISKLDNQISILIARLGSHKGNHHKSPAATLFDPDPVLQQDLWGMPE